MSNARSRQISFYADPEVHQWLEEGKNLGFGISTIINSALKRAMEAPYCLQDDQPDDEAWKRAYDERLALLEERFEGLFFLCQHHYFKSKSVNEEKVEENPIFRILIENASAEKLKRCFVEHEEPSTDLQNLIGSKINDRPKSFRRSLFKSEDRKLAWELSSPPVKTGVLQKNY